jgi:prepilin-type N-terminal cleavage/methylation domain-containing protein
MSIKRHNTRGGFTLIELLFAMALLGFMLTITVTTFIGVFRFYNWSNYTRQTQQQSRNLVETITREIRFQKVVSTGKDTPSSVTIDYDNSICLNDPTDTQKSKKILQHFAPRVEVIKVEYNRANCNTSPSINPPLVANSTVLGGGNQLRIGRLSFEQVYGATGPPAPGASQIDPSVIVDLRVATGANAVAATGGGYVCDPLDNFCGTANFTTVVNGKHP